MSYTQSAVVADLAFAVGLFTGGGGLLLGSIALADFEVPESVNFGGRQTVVEHKLIGGARTLDVMGVDDADRTWSGMMLGPFAVDRAQALDAMREAGAPVPLIFGPFAHEVIITSFAADYRRSNWIGKYTISCKILPPAGPSVYPGLSAGVNNDLGGAASFSFTGSLASAGAAVTTAQSSVGQLGNFLPGTTGVATALASVQTAQGAFTAPMAAATSTLTRLASSLTATGLLGGASGLLSALGASQTLANGLASTAYLGRAAANLTAAVA
jgi:hypothetical protein